MRQDDAVLPVVRVVAVIIVVVLVLAVIVLYGMPDETERFWAWTINPQMTPLLMGAGYAAGAYFFARAAVTRSWRTITLGFLPITAFTSLLLLATLLHWENFNHSHVAFFLWTFLYVVTPVLVPALWWVNRRRDPGREASELLIPGTVRAVLAVAGTLIVVLALVMFVSPTTAVDVWPWQLSDLTGRTVSAYLALTGLSLGMMAQDGRWRASKVLLESLMIGSALIVVGIVRAWDVLDPSATVRWVYAASMVGGLALMIVLWVRMESWERLRRDGDASEAATAEVARSE